jgi:hypothetical protein
MEFKATSIKNKKPTIPKGAVQTKRQRHPVIIRSKNALICDAMTT